MIFNGFQRVFLLMSSFSSFQASQWQVQESGVSQPRGPRAAQAAAGVRHPGAEGGGRRGARQHGGLPLLGASAKAQRPAARLLASSTGGHQGLSVRIY